MNTRSLKLAAVSLLALASALATGCASEEADDTEGGAAVTDKRPPQFVILAFDGSYNLDFWKESRQFAKEMNASGKPMKWTYFMSGVYFVPNAKKSIYVAPHSLGPGKSAIGFGGTEDEIKTRVEQVDLAAAEGHEMASHANGHFDGSSWSKADWDSEFTQFNQIFFGNKAVKALSGVKEADIVGFRAPQLGHSPGLFQTLPEKNYTYDTSKSAAANYWPEKKNGVWNMALAQLKIVGSGKNTLSMDYNFYVAHSRGNPDAANAAKYQKETIDTYRAYFKNNYYGNRAPIHIGHHFSKWNGAAYWNAMKDFAKEVCGKPEVKCVTYKELVTFMEGLTPEQRRDYQAGDFPKLPRPSGNDSARDVPANYFDTPGEGDFVGDEEGAHEHGAE